MSHSPEDAYRLPPDVLTLPNQSHTLESRQFQGIPSLAIEPDGRLWATWYAGKTPAEDHNNYVVIANSEDGGNTWQERLVIDPDGEGPVRAFDPEIWSAPDGRLWVFWAQGLDRPARLGPSGVWAMTVEHNGESLYWSEPHRLCDGVMMCKPIVLSTGEWALPVSFWHRRDAGGAAMVVSTDAGAHWHERSACDVPPDVRDHDEHMLVERQDGSLWMLVRTKYGIGESISSDSGHSWSPLTPAPIQHATTRFFIRRLASGKLLLVKHGPVHERTAQRSHLTAYLSDDDGKNWSAGLLLDERVGVSYPDGQQADDGVIHIIYDHKRTEDREILLAQFSEDDILDGALRSSRSASRLMVSKPDTSAKRIS